MVESAIISTNDASQQSQRTGPAPVQKIIELRVELPEFQRTHDERGNEVVFYMVHVCLGRRKWTLEKRYNNFSDLDRLMRSKHANLPKLPAKTYFKLKTDEQIDARRAQLHTYLQEIVNRPDMRTNPIFRSFLEIDEQIPESVSYQPVKLAEITDLQLGARDFCYVENRGFLFVAMSEMNIGSRLDSYITNFTMPWEKKKQKNASNNEQVYSTVGGVAMYKMKLTKNAEGVVEGWTFQHCWAKSFALQTGSMYWDDEEHILYIGFDQGRVVRLNVSLENPMQYTEMTELGIHTLRITGITADRETGTFTSVSDDGTFKVTENTSGSVVAQTQPSAGALKQLITFQQRNCLGISDAKGGLHLYVKTGSPLEHIVSLTVDSKSEIKGIALNQSESFLVAGCADGTINIFDLGANGRERLAKPLVTLQGNKGVRCLQWRERPRRELIAGHADGLVTIWDFKQHKPVFVLQAHTSAITKMEWHEDKQALITCAKDKCLKIWSFPPVWVDEESVDLQRPPDASAARKALKAKQQAANGASSAAAQDQDDDSSDSDDGLGRIRPNRNPTAEKSLPVGLGQVFNMNNPLAAAASKPKQPTATTDITKPPGLSAQQKRTGADQSAEEESKDEQSSSTEESKGASGAAEGAQAPKSSNKDDDQDEEEEKEAVGKKTSQAQKLPIGGGGDDSDDSDDLGGWNV